MDEAPLANKIDQKLRRLMLRVLWASRGVNAGGWINGEMLFDLMETDALTSYRCENKTHAMNLLRDLEAKGYAECRDDRTLRVQLWNLDDTSWRITATGSSLLEESAAPDPDIEDRRR